MPVRVWQLGLMRAALTLPHLTLPAVAVERPGNGIGPVIVVQGTGVVTARPDMAVINAGVTSQAETAKAALAAHGENMARVLAGLEAFGIAEGGVQSQHVNLRPVYPRQNSNDGVRARWLSAPRARCGPACAKSAVWAKCWTV
ncbi:MAG: SIMPL domain-containing protein [Alphaproteobacteria bacterium]